jgi:hypothetical protein
MAVQEMGRWLVRPRVVVRPAVGGEGGSDKDDGHVAGVEFGGKSGEGRRGRDDDLTRTSAVIPRWKSIRTRR